jgi:activating signal cointegrator complex subunit 1
LSETVFGQVLVAALGMAKMLTGGVDVGKASDETKEQLLQLVPTYESLATSSKVHLIQSLVSRLLVDRVFNEYFIGLSKEHADDLSKVEKYLTEFGEMADLSDNVESA